MSASRLTDYGLADELKLPDGPGGTGGPARIIRYRGTKVVRREGISRGPRGPAAPGRAP